MYTAENCCSRVEEITREICPHCHMELRHTDTRKEYQCRVCGKLHANYELALECCEMSAALTRYICPSCETYYCTAAEAAACYANHLCPTCGQELSYEEGDPGYCINAACAAFMRTRVGV